MRTTEVNCFSHVHLKQQAGLGQASFTLLLSSPAHAIASHDDYRLTKNVQGGDLQCISTVLLILTDNKL